MRLGDVLCRLAAFLVSEYRHHDVKKCKIETALSANEASCVTDPIGNEHAVAGIAQDFDVWPQKRSIVVNPQNRRYVRHTIIIGRGSFVADLTSAQRHTQSAASRPARQRRRGAAVAATNERAPRERTATDVTPSHTIGQGASARGQSIGGLTAALSSWAATAV
jgi:hypothetical protein